jgi:hypothetical protein
MKDTPKTPQPARVISNPFPESTSHNVESKPVTKQVQAEALVEDPKTTTSPSTAADNDLIEKTWVDAVNKMAQEYADDPFVLQQKQAELTRDYLKKRWGREIKSA